MSQPSSLYLKILSLAVVVWGLMSNVALSFQRASWVPWMALVLLMLLEAYSCDARPASWSRWSAGLAQLTGPAMLPYYAVLILSLAIGPGQMRHDKPALPHMGAASPALATSKPTRPSPPTVIHPSANPTPPGRPQVFQGTKFPRQPNTFPSAAAAPGAPASSPPVGKAPAVTASPAPFPPGPAGSGVARPAMAPDSSRPSTPSPTSTAKPPAAPAPTK